MRGKPAPTPWRWIIGVAVLVAVVAASGSGARAGRLSRTVADEPQYLLTALSLWEDHDLDIGDELAAERWRPFHEADLPRQTAPVDPDRPGAGVPSPHDPLLPVILAAPVGRFGWLGARLALAATAGLLAGLLVWTAHRRFGVAATPAAVVVGAFGVTAPLVAYGTQVYPELPAALAVTAVVAASVGRPSRRALAVVAVGLVALPWLSVKYVPVVLALAAVLAAGLWRDRRRRALLGLAVVGVVAGAAYLGLHRWWYGGWTVYAAGDHFTGGELTVMGAAPDHLSRAQRLVGLLVDRTFGLARWSPLWLLAVPASAALLRRRPPGWSLLGVPLAAGWLNATFLALTMHGWWWPGRQVVVVAPLAVLAVSWWAGATWVPAPVRRRRIAAVAALAAVGLWVWSWLLVEVLTGRRHLVTDFLATGEPLLTRLAPLLPDARRWEPADIGRWWAWAAVLALWALWTWRRTPAGGAPAPPEGVHERPGRADGGLPARRPTPTPTMRST